MEFAHGCLVLAQAGKLAIKRLLLNCMVLAEVEIQAFSAKFCELPLLYSVVSCFPKPSRRACAC